jgi:hypothetical protein
LDGMTASDTTRLLQTALSKMDELHHRLAVAEDREARERRDAQHRTDETRYLKSRDHLLDVIATARQYQARADDALSTWNIRAPEYTAGESLSEHRRRLAKVAQRQLPDDHEFRGVNLGKLDDDVFVPFEQKILGACKEAGTKPDSAAPNEMRMVERTDPSNGQKMIEFLGQRSFIHDFKPLVRRVRSFWTGEGPPMSASGAFLR